MIFEQFTEMFDPPTRVIFVGQTAHAVAKVPERRYGSLDMIVALQRPKVVRWQW